MSPDPEQNGGRRAGRASPSGPLPEQSAAARPTPRRTAPQRLESALARAAARWPNLPLFLETAAVLLLFFVVRKLSFVGFHDVFAGDFPRGANWLTRALGADSVLAEPLPFDSPSIFFSALRTPLFSLLLAAQAGVLFSQWRALRWEALPDSKILRLFVAFLALVLTWKHATYGYNFYWDQAYLLDRLLLIGLCTATYWRPLFLALFLPVLLSLMAQVNYPFSTVSFTQEKLPLDLALLFLSYLLVRAAGRSLVGGALLLVVYTDVQIFLPRGGLPGQVWIPLALGLLLLFWLLAQLPAGSNGPAPWLAFFCVTAANYWWPGLRKLVISPHLYEWVWRNDPANVLVYRYSQGWLGFASQELKVLLLDAMRAAGRGVSLVTLALELAAIAVLWRRRWTIALLGGFCALHAGIAMLLGVVFWEWFLVDLALLAAVRAGVTEQIQQRTVFLFSAGAILASPLLLHPADLAWFDTRLSHRIELMAAAKGGGTYRVAPSQMNPYHRAFAAGGYLFLVDGKTLLPSPRSYELARKIDQAGPERIGEVIGQEGVSRYDSRKARQFEDFIERWFENRNRGKTPRLLLSRIAPPPKFLNWNTAAEAALDQDVWLVQVLYLQQYYWQGRLSVKTQTLQKIPVPPE